MAFSVRLDRLHELHRRRNYRLIMAACRYQCNLSQEELGKAVGLEIKTISNIELGIAYPSMKSARKIAKVLGVKDYIRLFEMFNPKRLKDGSYVWVGEDGTRIYEDKVIENE